MRGQVDEGGAVELAAPGPPSRRRPARGDAVHGRDGPRLAVGARQRQARGDQGVPGLGGPEAGAEPQRRGGETVTSRPRGTATTPTARSAATRSARRPAAGPRARASGAAGRRPPRRRCRAAGSRRVCSAAGRSGRSSRETANATRSSRSSAPRIGPIRCSRTRPPASGDRDERAVGVDELEQPGVAEPGGQLVDACRRRQRIAGPPRCSDRSRMRVPGPSAGPAAARPPRPAGAVQLVDLQDGPAQGGEHLGGLRVVEGGRSAA